jgi:hypothetical protein
MRHPLNIALAVLLVPAVTVVATLTGARDDRKVRTFECGDASFDIFEGGPGAAAVFSIRGRSAKEGAIEYRIDASADQASLFQISSGSRDLRVGSLDRPRKDLTAEVAEQWIRATEGALPEWEAHQAFLAQAGSEDPVLAREGWRRVAARLEEAYEKVPGHLGILQDLISAYGRLNALEGQSARGLNLRILIPERLREFERRAGTLTAGEGDFVRHARAAVYLSMSLYPLAVREASTDEPSDVLVRKALSAIGADRWDAAPGFTVEGQAGAYEVDVYRSSADSLREGLFVHPWVFVPHQKGTAPSGALWYTLSRELQGGTPRFYLLGWVAGTSKPLYLYGTTPPSPAELESKVKCLMTDALGGTR